MIASYDVVWLLLALMTKHLVVDFPMQGPYQYKNKGTYGHPGGLLHSALHGAATVAVFFVGGFASPIQSIGIGVVDALVHYHIDWGKMNINKKLGWTPITHEEFWWLLGLDQYLHMLTYIGMLVYTIHFI